MAIIKKGKKEKNDKINEIRKRKLPIIKFEKGEVSWRLARVPHRDRVCVCNIQHVRYTLKARKKKKFQYSVGTQVSSLVLADLYLRSGWSMLRYLKRKSTF